MIRHQHRKRYKSRNYSMVNMIKCIPSLIPFQLIPFLLSSVHVQSQASTSIIPQNSLSEHDFQIQVEVQKVNYFVKESLEVTCFGIPKSKLSSLTITQRIINSDESENLVENNKLRPRYKADDWYLNQDPLKTSVRIEKRNLAMHPAFSITCELTDCKGGDRCRADSPVIHIRTKPDLSNIKITHQSKSYSNNQIIKINTDDFASLSAPFQCSTKGADPTPTIGFITPNSKFAKVFQVLQKTSTPTDDFWSAETKHETVDYKIEPQELLKLKELKCCYGWGNSEYEIDEKTRSFREKNNKYDVRLEQDFEECIKVQLVKISKPKKPTISASDMYQATAVRENNGATLFSEEFAYFNCDLENNTQSDVTFGDTVITRYQFQIDSKINDDLMSTSKTYKFEIPKYKNKIEIKCRARNTLGFGIWSDAVVFTLRKRPSILSTDSLSISKTSKPIDPWHPDRRDQQTFEILCRFEGSQHVNFEEYNFRLGKWSIQQSSQVRSFKINLGNIRKNEKRDLSTDVSFSGRYRCREFYDKNAMYTRQIDFTKDEKPDIYDLNTVVVQNLNKNILNSENGMIRREISSCGLKSSPIIGALYNFPELSSRPTQINFEMKLLSVRTGKHCHEIIKVDIEKNRITRSSQSTEISDKSCGDLHFRLVTSNETMSVIQLNKFYDAGFEFQTTNGRGFWANSDNDFGTTKVELRLKNFKKECEVLEGTNRVKSPDVSYGDVDLDLPISKKEDGWLILILVFAGFIVIFLITVCFIFIKMKSVQRHQKSSNTDTSRNGYGNQSSQHRLLTDSNGNQFLISQNSRGSQVLSTTQEDDNLSDTISPLLKVGGNRVCQSEIMSPNHRYGSIGSMNKRPISASNEDGRHEHMKRFMGMNYNNESLAGSVHSRSYMNTMQSAAGLNPVGSQILCDGNGNEFVVTPINRGVSLNQTNSANQTPIHNPNESYISLTNSPTKMPPPPINQSTLKNGVNFNTNMNTLPSQGLQSICHSSNNTLQNTTIKSQNNTIQKITGLADSIAACNALRNDQPSNNLMKHEDYDISTDCINLVDQDTIDRQHLNCLEVKPVHSFKKPKTPDFDSNFRPVQIPLSANAANILKRREAERTISGSGNSNRSSQLSLDHQINSNNTHNSSSNSGLTNLTSSVLAPSTRTQIQYGNADEMRKTAIKTNGLLRHAEQTGVYHHLNVDTRLDDLLENIKSFNQDREADVTVFPAPPVPAVRNNSQLTGDSTGLHSNSSSNNSSSTNGSKHVSPDEHGKMPPPPRAYIDDRKRSARYATQV